MSETGIMNKIQIALSNFKARLFRNQVGLYTLEDGRKIKSGLGPGSSDLIGWTTVQIKPKMVGHRVAIFTAVEVKSKRGRLQPNQENYINVVNQAGGIAFVARSSEEAVKKLMEGTHLANGTGF